MTSKPTQIWYIGKKHIFSYPKFRKGVFVKEVTESDHDIIHNCIQLFNSELEWDDMFNLDQAFYRLSNGHQMYVLFSNSPLGYVWRNKDYFYNLFVSKNRVKGDSQDFFNYVCKKAEVDIKAYVDSTNIKGQKFVERLGFTRIFSYI